MDELADYQHRRLALADLLRAALYLARLYRQQPIENDLRRLLAKLAEDRLQLAVVGQFSRGKSTLMNALLGGEYLPTGEQPVTAVTTTVRYGTRPRAWVRRPGAALPITVEPEQIGAYIAQAGPRRALEQPTEVILEIPAPLLRLGFAFVDTPGIGSAFEANTAATHRYLPQADAIIFVTGFDAPPTDAETQFLATSAAHAGKLFLVANKLDLIDPAHASAAITEIHQQLTAAPGTHETRLFALSALDALRTRDPRALEASGLPAFDEALTHFLTAQKNSVFLTSVRTQAARTLAHLGRNLSLGQAAAHQDIDAVETAFDAALTDLETRMQAAADAITRAARVDLPELIDARAARWHTEARSLLAAAVDHALADHGEESELAAQLEHATGPIIDDLNARRAAEAHDLLVQHAAGDIDRLVALSRAPARIGTHLAGLPHPDEPQEKGWTWEDLPAPATPEAHWAITLPPAHRTLRHPSGPAPLSGRVQGVVHDALAYFEQSENARLIRVVGDWAERLADQTHRALTAEAKRFRTDLHTPPRDEDLDVLADLVKQLETAQFPAAAPAHAAPPGPGTDPCPVCARVRQTLDKHLRHAQFLLATRGQAQQDHAARGGFCPLHTWQYLTWASPLGASSANAALADALADRLETSQPDVPRCPACTAVTSTEDEHAAATATGPDIPVLCLRHLDLDAHLRPRPRSPTRRPDHRRGEPRLPLSPTPDRQRRTHHVPAEPRRKSMTPRSSPEVPRAPHPSCRRARPGDLEPSDRDPHHDRDHAERDHSEHNDVGPMMRSPPHTGPAPGTGQSPRQTRIHCGQATLDLLECNALTPGQLGHAGLPPIR
jgi:GTPase SAR1 family protein